MVNNVSNEVDPTNDPTIVSGNNKTDDGTGRTVDMGNSYTQEYFDKKMAQNKASYEKDMSVLSRAGGKP